MDNNARGRAKTASFTQVLVMCQNQPKLKNLSQCVSVASFCCSDGSFIQTINDSGLPEESEALATVRQEEQKTPEARFRNPSQNETADVSTTLNFIMLSYIQQKNSTHKKWTETKMVFKGRRAGLQAARQAVSAGIALPGRPVCGRTCREPELVWCLGSSSTSGTGCRSSYGDTKTTVTWRLAMNLDNWPLISPRLGAAQDEENSRVTSLQTSHSWLLTPPLLAADQSAAC